MESSLIDIKPTATTKFIYKICKILYMTANPNYWFKTIELSGKIEKIRDCLSHFIDASLCVFILLEWGAFFTQHNLTEKQAGDRTLMSMAHVVQHSFVFCFKYYRPLVSEIIYKLVVELKLVYNDLDVEREMIRKVKMYTYLQVTMACMTAVLYGLNGIIQCWFTNDGTFTTVIPVWPDVNDRSYVAGVARVIIYVIWCIFVIRTCTASTLLITVTICLSYQYKNLASYFHSLIGIFDGVGTQKEKERAFEEAFVVGVRSHITTLWCTKKWQTVCNVIYSGQIVLNVTVLALLMLQMADPSRTAGTAATVAVTATALLLTTGLIMWSAGDLTVEASVLPSAMFHAGWQRCTGGRSARSLLAVAMPCAQQPVEMVCLGTVKLSYSSYVTIVKSSYSVFSVLY